MAKAGHPVVSGTVDRYLQKGVALRLVYEIMEPNLIWADYLKQVPEDSNAFMYQYDSTGKSSDTRKQKPPMQASGAKFARLDKSRITTASGLTQRNGCEIAIPREGLRIVFLVRFRMLTIQQDSGWLNG